MTITNTNVLYVGTSTNSTITPTVKIPCLFSEGAKTPQRQHRTDAGADLFSITTTSIYPGEQAMVDTGVAVKIPPGHGGFVFNRSSQGKQGVTIPHSVGVIDSDYRGTIKVILKNTGDEPYKIEAGVTRIAQLVIMPVITAEFVDTWNDTQRGTGGFGSTGT
jgi:dUTP pyrophosphatase